MIKRGKTQRLLEEYNSIASKTEKDVVEFIGKLPHDKLEAALWGFTEIFSKKQNIRFAVYAVKQVLPIYEDYFPNDARPRKNIEAAENWLNGDAVASYKAADVASDAALDAYSCAVTFTTARVARAASYLGRATAKAIACNRPKSDVAYSAYCAVFCAVSCAEADTDAIELKIKILKYGAKLFFGNGGNHENG